MKKIFLRIFPIMFLFIFGCSDDGDDSGGLGGIGGGGGNNTGNVTFTVSVVQDQQQQVYFEFKPSTGVIITSMSAKCTALNINEQLTDADISDDVFSNTAPCYVGPITVNLQAGQQWTFTISGNIGSRQGQTFTATSNYTVQ